MRPRVKKLGYLCLVTVLLCSCTRGFELSDLYGAYIADYSFGTDRITLKEDGTYIQEIKINQDRMPYTTTGNWEYDKAANQVIIDNCYVISDGLGQLRKNFETISRGPSVFPVERDLLSRRIRLGPDEANPYRKMHN